MELAQAWRAAGHTVDVFSMDEAFGRRTKSAPLNALRQVLFSARAASFIRRNRGRYDVVDALLGSLRPSKTALGFSGLLVARSVGLHRLYDRFERGAHRFPGAAKMVGWLYYSSIAAWLRGTSDAAVVRADVVNVPNEEEARCLRSEISERLSIIVHGYGLSEERRKAFAGVAAPPNVRLGAPTISFIGVWNRRKGARDWARILRSVWKQMPETRFLFLGTLADDERVLRDLGLSHSNRVDMVREFQPADLPGLLATSTAGAFPSYAEGFGFALLEQLAAGIPTVAYDSPGPRAILSGDLPELLVPAGEVERFSEELVRILRMDAGSYEQLADRSRAVAGRFDWTQIASETTQSYREKIARLR